MVRSALSYINRPFLLLVLIALPAVWASSAAWSAKAPPLTRLTADQLKEKFKGAPVTIVNFWATWCEPCKEEFPAFLKIRRDFEKKGVRVILVSMDFNSQEDAIHQFLKDSNVGFETFWKEGGDSEFISAVLPDWSGALPTTAFYDSNGKLVKMIQAKVDEKKLKEQINQTLKPAGKKK